ncbi:S8 family serine peptidase [Paenibacillus larvae]
MKKCWFILLLVFILIGVGSIGFQSTQAIPLSNDPKLSKQDYLQRIGIERAWNATPSDSSTVLVAVVDTGVDLNHPDLVGRLVDGVNLINPKLPPKDDNGHGTNVAGIIAATINNDIGIAGIAPNAKIMPIKAMEADGTGSEAKLGEGIRYAVDHGAKIVVLSLGLNKYSEYMKDTVKYAEDHDVLLVVATGNEAGSVKYPAAYPSVLSVGGVDANKQKSPLSNFGPELDIVAPFDVYTTWMGGVYDYNRGTSMAAPQVAGVAALVWGKYPDMKSYEVADLLKQTAEKLSPSGWNEYTGYGMLRADEAMVQPLLADRFKPNNTRETAANLPVIAKERAEFDTGKDQSWFALQSPYPGTVQMKVTTEDERDVSIESFSGKEKQGKKRIVKSGEVVSLPVDKGKNPVRLRLADSEYPGKVRYTIENDFLIYQDPFEYNDQQYKAFALPPRSQTIKGTFHKADDEDWYLLSLKKSGTLSLKCSVDTARIDPVVLIQKKGEKATIFDEGREGADEQTPLLNVMEGDYYIRISNAKEQDHPVMGEYTLSIDFNPKLIDPNEPNDKSYQASFIALDTEYFGLFHDDSDVDWFQFKLEEESLVEFQLWDIPLNRQMKMRVYDHSWNNVLNQTNDAQDPRLERELRLDPGDYYIRLDSDKGFDDQLYRLKLHAQPLVAGFSDIRGHWAENSIAELKRKQVISGYGDYRFEPERTITRSEASAILVNAFHLEKQKLLRFNDVPIGHWAYSFIAKAEYRGLVNGYEDGSFRPDYPLTRMEMTAMLAESMGKTGKLRGRSPFPDVSEDYWGVRYLKQLYADRWITGFPDETYHPDAPATRAEFVTMLAKLLNQR